MMDNMAGHCNDNLLQGTGMTTGMIQQTRVDAQIRQGSTIAHGLTQLLQFAVIAHRKHLGSCIWQQLSWSIA